MSAIQYFDHYKSKGFHFSNKILTKYCLSLYTKPFLILSGISGTGKTKIAQLFEVFVDDAVQQENVNLPAAGGYIILKINQAVLKGDRANFKYSDLPSLFEPEEIANIQAKIAALAAQGDNGNITEPETFTVEDPLGDYKIGIYLQRATNPLLRVRLKSKRGEADRYDSSKVFKTHYKEGDVLNFQKIGPRRLKIVSKNNEDIKKVELELDRKESSLVDNKLFISVKSNWTDNTELFGYYNVLEEKYNLTPLLKFILTAEEHPSKPFFLILDEMNLSKVEHYFSDFLSCLESRLAYGDNVKQEKIRLHNYQNNADTNDDYFDIVPNSVAIPLNLYVTGTVNIDETTYAFSPKVLDRANVIEFNDVNVSAYQQAQQEESFSLKHFPRFETAKLSSSEHFNSCPESFKVCVTELLNILQPYNLHFGYRVINEMALFVLNTIEFIGDEEDIVSQAIDIQICQKVLPKFNGSFGKLDEPLRKLIAFMLADKGMDYNSITIDTLSSVVPFTTKYPESLAKIGRLYNNLVYNGFASFLE